MTDRTASFEIKADACKATAQDRESECCEGEKREKTCQTESTMAVKTEEGSRHPEFVPI